MPAEGETPVRRGRGRPRDPSTDARITTAAAELLLERGFDKTTVDEVAARAGVGKATVYRRWPSKEDLAVSAMAELYDAEFPEPDTGSIRTDLAESYRAVLAFVNSPEGATFLRMSIAESVRDERIGALYLESTLRREAQSRVTFERAIAPRRGATGRRHRQRRAVAGRDDHGPRRGRPADAVRRGRRRPRRVHAARRAGRPVLRNGERPGTAEA